MFSQKFWIGGQWWSKNFNGGTSFLSFIVFFIAIMGPSLKIFLQFQFWTLNDDFFSENAILYFRIELSEDESSFKVIKSFKLFYFQHFAFCVPYQHLQDIIYLFSPMESEFEELKLFNCWGISSEFIVW